jgi:hypothetical protein
MIGHPPPPVEVRGTSLETKAHGGFGFAARKVAPQPPGHAARPDNFEDPGNVRPRCHSCVECQFDTRRFLVSTAAVISLPTPLGGMSTRDLESELLGLAGHIAATECRFLQLLAEFDERGGWAGDGIRSRAHLVVLAGGDEPAHRHRRRPPPGRTGDPNPHRPAAVLRRPRPAAAQRPPLQPAVPGAFSPAGHPGPDRGVGGARRGRLSVPRLHPHPSSARPPRGALAVRRPNGRRQLDLGVLVPPPAHSRSRLPHPVVVRAVGVPPTRRHAHPQHPRRR